MTRRDIFMAGLALGCFSPAKGVVTKASAQETPVFREIASEVDLNFHHFNGATGEFYMPEIMGPGVALFDYDNDGDLDVYLVQGTTLDPRKKPLFPPPPGWKPGNRLFRNELAETGKLRFTDVTEQAGVGHVGYGMGVAVGDYDNDGFQDLYVTNFGHNVLYRNNGDGTFTEVSGAAGISAASGSYGLTAVAADFNDDGWPDIYVACDSSPSLFFVNSHDGTFKESGLEMGVALNEDGQEQAGMGLGIGDFNLDGALDILKTHFTEDTPALYANGLKAGFTDVTIPSGLGVETRFVSWGAGIVDLDNNGLPDLFWVTGSVYPEVEKKLAQYPYRTPAILFRNLGGGRFEELFHEAGPGIAERHSSRGCAFGDFDNDGDLDILIVNLNEPPSLLRNDVKGDQHWIKVKLIGVKSNRSGIGARVVVKYGERLQVQDVLAQSSYLSVDDRRLHFGLGEIAMADLEIRWPSGQHQMFSKVAANQLVTIKEGTGIVPSLGFTSQQTKRI